MLHRGDATPGGASFGGSILISPDSTSFVVASTEDAAGQTTASLHPPPPFAATPGASLTVAAGSLVRNGTPLSVPDKLANAIRVIVP